MLLKLLENSNDDFMFENDKPSKLCGYSADTSEYQSYSSDGRALALQFFTANNSGPQYHSEITFTVTSFLKLHYNCDRKMFQCGNLRCIWKGLKCDGHNNCGDQSDESPHRASCGMLSPGGITAIVVGSVMGLLLLILLPFLCCRFCRSKYREEQSASGEPPLIQPTPSYGSGMERNFQHESDLTPPEPSTSYIRYQDPPPAYKP
ncbi:uncharacterized protein CEXT_120321 [Caerostris extrusa]|uniref:Uncharacterized protein n=1 Tax=Caerostris extrusa TaxID=172846 RepID=A0AAV4QEA1_CAEEX|nr:uncharacterized protein CEXT_120321 [Caerostris extrusa]